MSLAKAKALFVELVASVPEAQWDARLAELAGGDDELRRQVSRILAAHREAGSFLEAPAPALDATMAAPVAETPGAQIGPYKLLEQIGEGGMGTVWMAEQQEPIQRRVAVKVVRAGMDSRQVLARFEAERQALALMDHPNIAKVLDAGTVGHVSNVPESAGHVGNVPHVGRPYFVMELVKGTPITKYCDEKHLGVRERLALFADVCQAVQHAHQKGIIHRDIKPSNILVAPYDGKPIVKVIDFGVAKATGQRLTDATLFTGFGAVVGTPEYMSPEQAEVNNQDIDTRSDIYSLGVLLYELLTGSTPLTRKRVKEAALLEVLRVIREEEPPRPSTRLSSTEELPSISAQRQTEPAKLTKLVRGELDWIVMKALEKDRNRRYETANGFAMDVQRYLADEQVQACPPSAGYRLRKFARRNKGAFVTIAAVALALILGTAISTWQAVRATEAENLAQERFEAEKKAREQTEEARKEAVANLQKAREAVDQMLTRVGDEGGIFADQPGMTRVRRALLEDALKFYEGFLQQQSTDPVIRAETGLAYFRVGNISVYLFGDWDRAQQAFTQAVPLLEQALVDFPTEPKYPHALGRCLNRRAEAFNRAGRLEEAVQEHRRALAQFEREGRLQLSPRQERNRRQELGYTYLIMGGALAPTRPQDAEQAFRHLLDLAAKLDAEFPNDLIYQRYLAFGSRRLAGLLKAKQPEKALPLYKRSAELFKKSATQFPDHPLGRPLAHEGGATYSSLGNLLTRLGRTDEARAALLEAVPLFQRSAEQYEKLSLQVRPEMVDFARWAATEYVNLAQALSRLGRTPEAITSYKKAIAIDPKLAPAHNNLGTLLRGAERIACYKKAIEIDPTYEAPYNNLRSAPGGDLNSLSIAIYRCRRAATHEPLYINLVLALEVLLEQKKAEHVAWFRGVMERNPTVPETHFQLGLILTRSGKPEEAIACFRTAIELDPKNAKARSYLGGTLNSLAWTLATDAEPARRDPARAVSLASEAVELDAKVADRWNALGAAHYRAGNYKEAVASFHKFGEPRGTPYEWPGAFFLAMTHWRLGNKGEAVRWHERAVEWMGQAPERGHNPLMRRLRAESAELLKIDK